MTSIAVVCGSATLGTPGATPDWECATDAAESTAIRNGSMPCIGAPLDAVWYRATSSKEYDRTLLRQKILRFHKALDKEVPRLPQQLLTPLSVRSHAGHHQH